jgi:hypothetical protein
MGGCNTSHVDWNKLGYELIGVESWRWITGLEIVELFH